MARGASGLLDAIAQAESCTGGAKPAVPAATGPATTATSSCQQQLSFESCQQPPLWPNCRVLPHKGKRATLSTDQINDLHHLYWAEHWPIRKIEQHLRMSWHTIKKYLESPAQTQATRSRISKLDPFKPTIAELLEKDARASAAVIEQRLRPLGYNGGHTILRDYIHNVRPQPQSKRAFVRMEPEAGERFEVDWGHFGTLSYEGDQRKLYAFALVDGHSRMSYCRRSSENVVFE